MESKQNSNNLKQLLIKNIFLNSKNKKTPKKHDLNIINEIISSQIGVSNPTHENVFISVKKCIENTQHAGLFANILDEVALLHKTGIPQNLYSIIYLLTVLSSHNNNTLGSLPDSKKLPTAALLPPDAKDAQSSNSFTKSDQQKSELTKYNDTTKKLNEIKIDLDELDIMDFDIGQLTKDKTKNGLVAFDSQFTEKERFVRNKDSLLCNPNLSYRKPSVSHFDLIRDCLTVLRSINGKYISHNANNEGYVIDAQYHTHIPAPLRHLVNKISEIGWYHRQIIKYIEHKKSSRSVGLITKAIISFLSVEDTKFTQIITAFETLLNQELEFHNNISLRYLFVSTRRLHQRLKYLINILVSTKDLKGGNMLSLIYAFTEHGDPFYVQIAQSVLDYAFRPIKFMLYQFLTEGILYDPYKEFFIVKNKNVNKENYWKKKFVLLNQMIPSFIDINLAKKILMVGKNINYIKFICIDMDVQNRDFTNLKSKIAVPEKSNFLDADLENFVNSAYHETSKQLLDLVLNEFKLLDHLKAIRSYLLLGQGDFITFLMDVLKEKLSDNAKAIHYHNIISMLDSAVRATNAQYDPADITKRLDCRLFEPSEHDKGWDIFSLDYRISGPLVSIFSSEIMSVYHKVFCFLWKIKRFESSLNSIWLELIKYSKKRHLTAEKKSLTNFACTFCSRMLHFVTQFQYYLTYEALECNLIELVKKMNAADDLDMIILAHQDFLNRISKYSFLDSDIANAGLMRKLRSIIDFIPKFEQLYSALKPFLHEEDLEVDQSDPKLNLEQVCFQYQSKLVVYSESFVKLVSSFIDELNSNIDYTIRSLCFRLDFNNFYNTIKVNR